MVIPGLDFEDIVEGIVSHRHGESLSLIKDEDERRAKYEEYVEYYSSGDAALEIRKEIASIQANASSVEVFVNSLTAAVSAVVLPTQVPQLIVVGQATATINPAYYKAFIAPMKSTWLAMVAMAQLSFGRIVESCDTIAFTSPDVLTGLESQLQGLRKTIEAL